MISGSTPEDAPRRWRRYHGNFVGDHHHDDDDDHLEEAAVRYHLSQRAMREVEEPDPEPEQEAS